MYWAQLNWKTIMNWKEMKMKKKEANVALNIDETKTNVRSWIKYMYKLFINYYMYLFHNHFVDIQISPFQ